MSGIRLDIVTAERVVYSEDVDAVVAPGVEGQLGILPHHTPLMTTLQAGELWVRKGGEEFFVAISGGFLEVQPDVITILADTAIRADDLDEAAALEAQKVAEQAVSNQNSELDYTRAAADLAAAVAQLRTIQQKRR